MSNLMVRTEPKHYHIQNSEWNALLLDNESLSGMLKSDYLQDIKYSADGLQATLKGFGSITINTISGSQFPEFNYRISGLMGYTLELKIQMQESENALYVSSESQIPALMQGFVKPQLLDFQNKIRDRLCQLNSPPLP